MAQSSGGTEQGATGQNTAAADRVAAGGIIGAHTLQHLYQNGFYVILPELYTALGLTPVAAGAIETVRRVGGGVASMGGGVLLDRFQRHRIAVLYASLVTMGVGYLLVGVAPTYAIIVAAVGFASAAGSVWHPAALSLLSQRYPQRRGFVVSVHRSAGSFGDLVGPLAMGALLLVVSWQAILYGALPISLLFALALWIVISRAGAWRATQSAPAGGRLLGAQFRDLGTVLRSRSLLMLLLVAGLSGLGQGGLMLWLGLYLRETQGMGSVGIGVHIALLTGFGIVAGPMLGALSDRLGRKPVIVSVLACKTVIATLMALVASGPLLTVLVAMMGAIMFGTGSLIQAAALDLVEGRDLEGSMIGLLWGSNAAFVGASPLIVGLMIQALGFGVLFWYVAAMNVVATAAAVLLPALRASAPRAAKT